MGGTNGGLPIRLKQIETKVAQRALTLIGGGCENAFFAKSTSMIESTGNTGAQGGGGNNTKSQFATLTSQQRKKVKRFNHVHGSVSNKKRKKAIMHQPEKNSGIHSKGTNSHNATLNKNDMKVEKR